MHGKKNVVLGIMANLLPDEERREFKRTTANMSSEDFFRILPVYFNDADIKTALAEYAMEHLAELESDAGVRIDAIVSIYGQQYNFRSFNEVAGI